MGRAVFATALAVTTSACALIAGLDQSYAPARDAADALDDGALRDGEGADATDTTDASDPNDALRPVDARDASPPSCSSTPLCPPDAACDDFSDNAALDAWTTFPLPKDADSSVRVDLANGCPPGSLDVTNDVDQEFGVYLPVSGTVVSIEADVYFDKLGMTGDVMKIAPSGGYELRLHYDAAQLYLLEVKNSSGTSSNAVHPASYPTQTGAWMHVLFEFDGNAKACSLAIDGVTLDDGEMLKLEPSFGGQVQAALTLRAGDNHPFAAHYDNVVVRAK
jgi:hypothetical protein